MIRIIKTKILPIFYKDIVAVGFSLIIIIMAITSHLASKHLITNVASHTQINKDHDGINNLLAKMSQAILNRSLVLKKIVGSDNPFERDELFQELNNHASKFSEYRKQFKKHTSNQELNDLLDQQWQLARENTPSQNIIYDLMMEDKVKEAKAVLNKRIHKQNEVLNIQNQMALHLYNISKENFHSSHEETQEALSFTNKLDYLSIFLSLFLASIILAKKNESFQKLKYQASTDALTKLPNRPEIIKRISIDSKQNPSSQFAVILLDIDEFKSINDNYGHEVGDKVLMLFSETISSLIKPSDILSRFGGDEFVLILKHAKSIIDVEAFVSKLSKALDTSYNVDGSEVFVSSSIGISLHSHDSQNPKELLKLADIAMYTAKNSGKNCYSFYSKKIGAQVERNHRITHKLRRILTNNNNTGELYLMFQPLVNIETGKISDCEALIRWKCLDGTVISPSEFIPLTERSNLIEMVNHFVINESCKKQLEWKRENLKQLRININLSGNEQMFSNALNLLESNIEKFNLDPSLFGIELTERTIFDVSKKSIMQLKEIRSKGMKISIDDFGTGYSSLSYLRKLPLTTLKIDKEFISNLSTDFESQILVKMIISLGKLLKLEVVAEGVETLEQLKFLEKNYCCTAQGFYLHKPLRNIDLSVIKNVA